MTASQLLADVMANKSGYMRYSEIERRKACETAEYLVQLGLLRYMDLAETGKHVALTAKSKVIARVRAR